MTNVKVGDDTTPNRFLGLCVARLSEANEAQPRAQLSSTSSGRTAGKLKGRDPVNFLALDFETTGFSPKRDRIVEVGAVLFESGGRILHEYHTLVNPKCEVRASHIHGICDSDVMDAPEFIDILPSLIDVLNGNVIVAHNKVFDLGFLLSELLRVGIQHEVLDGICTLELVSHAAPSAPRKLIECCSAFGLPLEQGHHALNDARMTAHLASFLLPRSKGFRIPKFAEIRLPHSITGRGRQLVPRDAVYHDAIESGDFLASLVSKLPSGDGGQRAGMSQYMDMLDKVISSGSLSTDAASDLVELAARLGLGQKKILTLHLEYFKGLCDAATADHYISNRERLELKTAALFLKIENWESLVDQPTGVTVWKGGISRFKEPQKRVLRSSFAQLEKTTDFNSAGVKELLKGKSVLVTGIFDEFSRDQAKEAIRKRGGHVPDSPSRRTFAIVAGREAGPKKLEQASEWGVPILNLKEFLILLETGDLPER